MTKDYVARGTDGKYNWATANTICPIGWTLPSKANFEELISGLTTAAELVAKGFPSEADKQWWSGQSSNVDGYYLRINSEGGISGIGQDEKNSSKFVCCVKE